MNATDFETPTRDSYDAIAQTYADWVSAELTAKPHDRAVLAPSPSSSSPPATPRRSTSGAVPAGSPLSSPASARCDRPRPLPRDDRPGHAPLLRPRLHHRVDDVPAYPENSFSGALAWYSLIHIPDETLDRVIAEAARVLRPGGLFQLAFQLGDTVDHFSDLAGHEVDLDFHRRSIDDVLTVLTAHGFSLVTRMEREPDTHGRYPESTPQGYLLVRLDADDRLGEDHY